MKITLSKEVLLEKITKASHFVLTKLSSSSSLSGGLFICAPQKLQLTTTNLNDFYHAAIPVENGKNITFAADIKKIGEFLNYLTAGKITLEVSQNTLLISNNKTTGSFPLIAADDFPTIPAADGKKYRLKKNFLEKTLPIIVFAASSDEARPILTGINFSVRDNKTYIASTDGFRLSVFWETQNELLPEVTLSSQTLSELSRTKTKTDDVTMIFSEKGKMVSFIQDTDTIHSRIIEGDFPAYEKVIPSQFTTRVVVEKEDFLKNIKLASVFARDFSRIILLDVQKDAVIIRPRAKEEKNTFITQDGEIEGKALKIAFNYTFILDFLSAIKSPSVIIEMTESNAPSVFKIPHNDSFLHIIMPVRTDDEPSGD